MTSTEPFNIDTARENLGIYEADGHVEPLAELARAAINELERARRDLAANERSEDARLAIAEETVTHLRGELETIGNLAYRCDPSSPFVAEALEQIHNRAKAAVKGGDRE